jgi:hypothetical protein
MVREEHRPLGWFIPSTLSFVKRWLRTNSLGTALLAGSLVATAILALMSSSTQPPSTLESWLLAFLQQRFRSGPGLASAGLVGPIRAMRAALYDSFKHWVTRHMRRVGSSKRLSTRLKEMTATESF